MSAADASATRRRGQVITFYSFKGGTGRSMALANTACLLAQRSESDTVLIIDWDLEAPGLDRYFADLMHGACGSGKDYAARVNALPGLIDFLSEVRKRQSAPSEGTADALHASGKGKVLLEAVDLGRFVFPTDQPRVSLMKAGAFDPGYGRKVSEFGWVPFHTATPDFFTALAEELARRYTYVLIDSRTGITDSAEVCTALLPERLVTVFTPNQQSLTGVVKRIVDITAYRRQSTDMRPLAVFPLVSRVDTSEGHRKDEWRFGNPGKGIPGYQPIFESLFTEIYGLEKYADERCDLAAYFDDVQIQYISAYSFGEPIAALLERPGDALALAASYRRFVDRLIGSPLPWINPADSKVAASELQSSRAKAKELEQQLSHSVTRTRRWTYGFGMLGLGIVILAAISIPAYQDYSVRAQVTEGLALSASVRAAVLESFYQNERFPATNIEAGFPGGATPTGQYTQSVDVGPHGTIAVVYGRAASPKIAGKRISYIPFVNPTLDVTWRCTSSDLPQAVLPKACRNDAPAMATALIAAAAYEQCLTARVTSLGATDTFTQTGSVSCASASLSGKGRTNSAVVTYKAPPGFNIVGQVKLQEVSNISGSYGTIEYERKDDLVTSVRVSISCRSLSKPFGPGGSMVVRLVGQIQQTADPSKVEAAKASCLPAPPKP